jgi:hypothetical protein
VNGSQWSKRWLGHFGILLMITLVLSLWWDISNGLGASEVFTAIGLLMVLGLIIYFKRMENVSENAVSRRIKAEYPAESQPQVFEIYEHLRRKEIEGLFLKILEDAHGDLSKVKSLANLAESVGWKAFIENHW